MLHGDITNLIIKAFYKVYNTLGYGFLEKVYENAMRIELSKMGLIVLQQKNIKVFYESDQVGEYYADLLVNGSVIIELKAAENICEEHEAQLLNYLKATDIEVGLLLNFGKEPKFKRKFFTNDKKKNPFKSV
jgi:GxxExxY protein